MKKILIVDDDMDIVELIKNRLGKHGYEVMSAEDGDKGYKKAIQFKPDLIIMDIMMPVLPGPEAVKRLKANDATKHIPVIFFTALSTSSPDDTEESQINVGGQLYPSITKPFDPNKLLSTIESILNE